MRRAPRAWVAAACLLLAATAGTARVGRAVETYPFTTDPLDAARLRPWGMNARCRDGWVLLNTDHRARPWAGIALQPPAGQAKPPTLTPAWLASGYVRLRVRGLADAYGKAAWPGKLQLRLTGAADRYLQIPRRFYAPGPAGGSDPIRRTALVPMGYLGAKAGSAVTALHLQCVGRPASSFAVADVALVRFARPLKRDTDRAAADVAQPHVTWPTCADLPDSMKLPRNAPLFRDGRFVTADGRRTFLLMPWGRENQRLALGYNDEGKLCGHFSLYDPKTQGFIYEQPLAAESMSRLGFNAYAGSVHPVPFWKAIGYDQPHYGRFGQAEFRRHVAAMGYPFYVDFVCFPWTLGKPAADKAWQPPPGLLHDGSHHWTPYRIIGPGREAWLKMWRLYARRYKDAGARVILYELFNEPAYAATTEDHRAEFVAWLKARYGTLGRVNETWATSYASWDEVRRFKSPRAAGTGVFFDYDEYLGDALAGLVRAGRDAVEEITPSVPAAVQVMGGYALQPREAVFLAKLIPHQRAVLTPTGGGRWTRGVPNERAPANTIDLGIGPAPLANDLLLAMSGGKMIVDNETYLGAGQTRRHLRNRLWRNVLVGMDGCAWFSWSKRGWAWWQGRERLVGEADLFGFSSLIPFARRADAIRGALDFAREMDLVGEYVLPKPWQARPKIALIHSWANARWRTWQPEEPDKTGHYHAAMRYLHWSFDVLPSHLAGGERLGRYELIVAGGIDHVEGQLLGDLAAYVRAGGWLVVAGAAMGRDLYGKDLSGEADRLLGARVGRRVRCEAGSFRLVGLPEVKALPGEVTRAASVLEVAPAGATEVLYSDSQRRPIVLARRLGKGEVVFVAADLRGYPLGKLLAVLRRRAGLAAPTLAIADAKTGQLAGNVLVSRRSYRAHHALLLLNADGFPKRLRLRLRGLEGDWHVSAPLAGRAVPSPGGRPAWQADEIAKAGIPHTLAADDFALLLLTRQPWPKTTLAPPAAPRP